MSGHRFDVHFPLEESCNCCFRVWHIHRTSKTDTPRTEEVDHPAAGHRDLDVEHGVIQEQPVNKEIRQQ